MYLELLVRNQKVSLSLSFIHNPREMQGGFLGNYFFNLHFCIYNTFPKNARMCKKLRMVWVNRDLQDPPSSSTHLPLFPTCKWCWHHPYMTIKLDFILVSEQGLFRRACTGIAKELGGRLKSKDN